ncbi:hypothetical protein [Vacuolonema iberomarrocanum]|uniref:PIN-like domain-containing protein n=1 Tax=Vacuolonema iberomarrocanum TaxID=3454632 RepID=UPI0019D907B2|nr:hypothetical protein [filamentous cyanobacterium LEGE 07170]
MQRTIVQGRAERVETVRYKTGAGGVRCPHLLSTAAADATPTSPKTLSQKEKATQKLHRVMDCLNTSRTARAVEASFCGDGLVEIASSLLHHRILDVDWVPDVSRRGWVILTVDERIGKRLPEQVAIAQAQAKVFVMVRRT